jgi:hypothetical protein
MRNETFKSSENNISFQTNLNVVRKEPYEIKNTSLWTPSHAPLVS